MVRNEGGEVVVVVVVVMMVVGGNKGLLAGWLPGTGMRDSNQSGTHDYDERGRGLQLSEERDKLERNRNKSGETDS